MFNKKSSFILMLLFFYKSNFPYQVFLYPKECTKMTSRKEGDRGKTKCRTRAYERDREGRGFKKCPNLCELIYAIVP